MSSTPSGEFFASENYQNPQQGWVCGHHAEGSPCPIGPNGSGGCLVARICVPEHDGTAWHCTRARIWGGRCKDGPVPDSSCPDQKARCPHQPAPCQPERSLRNKRRLVTGITAAAALGCCLLILGGSSGASRSAMNASTAIVSPGPLTAHHATTDRGCAACHSAASKSPLDLLTCAFGGSGGLEDSRKCLECHDDFGKYALLPHSLDSIHIDQVTERLNAKPHANEHTDQQRLARMLDAHSTTDSGEIACSTCHHEHRGVRNDLAHLTNSQCQTCHASTFHSLTHGHPELPERERSNLHFDHSTHMQLHFQSFARIMPNGTPRTQCSDCHLLDSSREMMDLASFEVMCGSCHDRQIRDHDAPLNLRMHTLKFVSAGARKSAQPPADSGAGDEDRVQTESAPASSPTNESAKSCVLPPFMELMLGSAPATTVAYADAVKKLITDLADDGEATVRARLKSICGESTDAATIEACVDSLTKSHFFEAMAACKSSLLAAHDQEAAPQDCDEQQPGVNDVAFCNWKLTNDGRTLVYNCDKHADAVLRTWLDLLALNVPQYPDRPANDKSGGFDRFFRDLASPESTGRCIKCHTVDGLSGGRFAINWRTRHGHRSSRGFTRFTHKPHLTLLSSDPEASACGNPDQRCETCHAVTHGEVRLRNPAFSLDDGMPDPVYQHFSTLGVNSVRRADCAKCHTPELAGDNCLQCHNYHVHATTLKVR